MGMGDVKLLAGIGGWLGYQAIIPTIFYGSILGAVGGLGGHGDHPQADAQEPPFPLAHFSPWVL